MSFAAISLGVGAAAAIGSVAVQASAAKKQRRLAEQINPVDPGTNPALEDNARLLRERYGNYVMPGFDSARSDINMAGQNAFGNAVQGATSSNDVLDAATRIAYGTQRSMGDLYRRNAIGKEQALAQYLAANEAAGTDSTNWNRQQYMTDVQNKAQLTNAAEINRMNAIQSGLGAVGSLSSYAAGMFGNRSISDGSYYGVQSPSSSPGSTGYIESIRPGADVVPATPVANPEVSPTSLGLRPYISPELYLRRDSYSVNPYRLPY